MGSYTEQDQVIKMADHLDELNHAHNEQVESASSNEDFSIAQLFTMQNSSQRLARCSEAFTNLLSSKNQAQRSILQNLNR